MDIEAINSQAARIGKTESAQQKDDLARAFVAAFRQADSMATQVTDAQKKEREEDQKRRQKPTKDDLKSDEDKELENILEEIDSRLEKMLEIAKDLDD